MKKDLILCSAILITICFLTACTKTGTSAKGNLVGTWSYLQVATDDNSNGKADSSEWETLASYGASGLFIFKSDSSGSSIYADSSSSDTTNFRWWLTPDNTNLVILAVGPGVFGSTPDSAHIDLLTAHKLILKIPAQQGIPTEWDEFTK